MEGLAGCSFSGRFLLPFSSPSRSSRSFSFRRPGSSRIFAAARDGPELDKWDQMELKFGRLLGEDPKLTLAKIMARKSNSGVSYLDIEKSFNKKKGKLEGFTIDNKEDMNVKGQASILSDRAYFSNENPQNMPREGSLNLSRPIMNKGIKAAGQDVKPALTEKQTSQLLGNIDKGGSSSVALRKPSAIYGDDTELDKYSKLKIKPNVLLKMRNDSTENFSNVGLHKKPMVVKMPSKFDLDDLSSGGSIQSRTSNDDVTLLNTSEISSDKLDVTDELAVHNSLGTSIVDKTNMADNDIERPSDSDNVGDKKSSILDDDLDLPPMRSVEPFDIQASTTPLDQNSMNVGGNISKEAVLVGKLQREVEPSAKKVSHSTGIETISLIGKIHNVSADIDKFIPEEQEEREDSDWKRAVDLVHAEKKDEVEVISCSSSGFVVSFGSLIGFLPYQKFATKWRFLAFESWLRGKGLDPSMYRNNLSIVGSYGAQSNNLAPDSNKDHEISQKSEKIFPPNMKFEELLEIYDQEKTKFLSSFIGQKIRVSVVVADRESRRLLFSGRPKEKEEVVEKKRQLMAKLRIGDVVKCRIKKITYLGIFVEVEGVAALIHQSEVSWDATLDPALYYKIDQIIEAKVHQLNYARERFTLSLREVLPDPLMETLESMQGNLEAVQAVIEWDEVESLIKELQQIDGVRSVSKGRFFLSPGLAPNFQVYMASVLDYQYKLLARYENKVQEVIVQASLDKEQMKAAVLACTNRVV